MRVFDWSPGIGDPTLLGWVTVGLYFTTAWLSWRMIQKLRAIGRNDEHEITIWRIIALLFLVLGINKQLDLQSAVTAIGRQIALHQGWYGRRETVQFAFIAAVVGICLAMLGYLLRRGLPSIRSNWLAILGTASVLAYVLIRAASFHHVDRIIGQTILGARWNWVLEIGGIAVVLIAGLRRQRLLVARTFG